MSAAEIGELNCDSSRLRFLAGTRISWSCEKLPIKFIPALLRSAMQSMANRTLARAAARKAGVPVTPVAMER